MTNRRVVVVPSRAELVELVADKAIIRLRKTCRRRGHASVVLTGGSVGIDVLRAMSIHPERDSVPWEQVSVWWGDERFVPADHPDRNDGQAWEALLTLLPLRAENIHRFPAAGDSLTVGEAAEAFREILRSFGSDEDPWPSFDLAFAGIGPDAHVLSVFPGSAEAGAGEPDIRAVTHSPKPPAERLTFTIPLLNRADRVWIIASGAEKAAAVGLALADASPVDVPASAVAGRKSTKIFIDDEVASLVPSDLRERERFWSAEDERADYVPNALR